MECVMASQPLAVERRAEVVDNYTDGDAKANFSFFVSICADGARLPLIKIARGETARCHKQFGDQAPDGRQIWPPPRGWPIEDLMLHYLYWLREHLPNRPVCLILSQYGTYETDSFQAKAQHLGISLLWIPKGATGVY
jgi:hypothetical protein